MGLFILIGGGSSGRCVICRDSCVQVVRMDEYSSLHCVVGVDVGMVIDRETLLLVFF